MYGPFSELRPANWTWRRWSTTCPPHWLCWVLGHEKKVAGKVMMMMMMMLMLVVVVVAAAAALES